MHLLRQRAANMFVKVKINKGSHSDTVTVEIHARYCHFFSKENL